MDCIQKSLKECLNKLIPLLGRQPDLEINQMHQLVNEYYLNDRVRYIEIYEREYPRHWHLSGDGGIVGKTIPIAQKSETSSTVRRRRHLSLTKYCVIELLVAADMVKPVICYYEIERRKNRNDVFSVKYRVYYDLVESEIDESYTLSNPYSIRPISTTQEAEIYSDLIYIFKKIGSYYNPNIVDNKAERAIQFLLYAPRTRIRIDGKCVYGKLLEIASSSGLRCDHHFDHSHSYGRDLMLFVTKNSYQFLYKTTHIYRYFKRVPVDEDCSGGFIIEPLYERQGHEYSTISLDEIDNKDDDLIPGFY